MSKIATLMGMLLTCVLLLSATLAHAADDPHWLEVEVGKSVVLETPKSPTTIAMTDSAVANFEVLNQVNRLQVQGIAIGTTDLIVTYGEGDPPDIYEITVNRDLSDLIRRIEAIVEGEPPRAYPLEDRIVIEGAVDDLDTLEQVALVAQIYDEEFVNLMQVRGDHQVQLEVMFAEVSRTATRAMGMNVMYGSPTQSFGLLGPQAGLNTVNHPGAEALGGTIGGAAAGGFDVLGYYGGLDLGAVISVMDQYNIGKVLAQPTLVSLSGQQSEFMAGGEIPIPTQGGVGVAPTTTLEGYGIALSFVPTVLAGNVIDIQMELEISEPDFSVATKVGGTEVPGKVTRKGKHHLRVESGMTFAVAGLLSENSTYNRVGVPGLGKIPLLGMFFRQVRHVRDETEVVIYVTPRLVRPLAPGEVPAAPGTTENNNPGDIELYIWGLAHRPGSRTAAPTGAVGLQR